MILVCRILNLAAICLFFFVGISLLFLVTGNGGNFGTPLSALVGGTVLIAIVQIWEKLVEISTVLDAQCRTLDEHSVLLRKIDSILDEQRKMSG